jgi:hypothetical protein
VLTDLSDKLDARTANHRVDIKAETEAAADAATKTTDIDRADTA